MGSGLKIFELKAESAIATYGANRVAVYLVAFDVVPIFIQAQSHPALSTVKWYGSDGSVLNNKLVKSDEAAKFAVKTDFLNPIYGVENDNNENFKHIISQIQEDIGRAPRSYASVAYDALWVAALAENDTMATNNVNHLKTH
jgi:branched-chain amino acid transport system substrate-binding protein